ncbi:lysylphosphatidylglycerol synthase domain-containing protein [Bosea sp. (in: a-proteobacteria)]|uniref:lysylphosphatidylglycerol synthase domain-containing protein n=1 Tax=Bosea sp. (in: a-proteobacteria) TaxID=1871050 RepID=UPI003F6F758C
MKPLLAIVVIGLAAFLLYRTLREYSLDELAAQIRSAAIGSVVLALIFAAGSYACLTSFDFLALRYAQKPLPYPRSALASFVALSLGHNLGFAALSSGAIRYRYYSRWGLSAGDVAKVILFCAATVGIGLAVLAAVALVARQDLAMRATGLPQPVVLMLAATIALCLAGYLAVCVFLRRELRIWGWSFQLPTPSLAVAQMLVGPLNFALVAACLHQSLAAIASVSYPDVASAYVLANIAALVSHVPGGLGVIEAVVTLLLPGSQIIGGLIIFRFVYFLVPLLIGGIMLAASELWLRRTKRAGTRSQ